MSSISRINESIIKSPESEYLRQKEIEKFYDIELSLTEKELLNQCNTTNIYTIIMIGIALKTHDDLNVARLLLIADDPQEESPLKNKALSVLKDVDIEKTKERISCHLSKENLSDIEFFTYTELVSQDYF